MFTLPLSNIQVVHEQVMHEYVLNGNTSENEEILIERSEEECLFLIF